jgi:DNA-damage-inducible protein D
MTPLELVFTMLGEVSTREITVHREARGFQENKKAAQDGGTIAGNARKELEKKTGKKVVSGKNYLSITSPQKHKQLPEQEGKG